MTSQEIIALLKLEPLSVEGGFFRRTYSAPRTAETPAGARLLSSAIYYLIEAGDFSEMHELPSDELFHFYLGDPVEMLQLHPDGSSARFVLGQDLAAGQLVQCNVPGGVWQGTHLLPGGAFALLGCTVTPGFEYADYSNAPAEELIAKWPQEAELIRRLSRR